MANITPAQADTVLEVNRANAIKQAVAKVKSNKPLSRQEVDLLQSIAYSPGSGGDPSITVAKTVVELAEALGCSRRSISNWRKLEGAPPPTPTARMTWWPGGSSCTSATWTAASPETRRA